jgi:hypothetical protein
MGRFYSAFLLFAGCLGGPLFAQTPYELHIGMSKNAVRSALADSVYQEDAERSSRSDSTFSGNGFSLYFCQNQLRVIQIDLKSSVMSFTRAVERETVVRGRPVFHTETPMWASLKAELPRRDGGKFWVSLSEYNEDTIKVTRWESSGEFC